MINMFKVKKMGALLFNSFFSAIMFYIGLIYYGLFGGIGFLMAGVVLGYLIGSLMLNNPFTDMLEGKGILALNIDSTGIINAFILAVKPPYLTGSIFGKPINDVFNRDSVFQLQAPKRNSCTVEVKPDGGLNIDLDGVKATDGRFVFQSYPCIIYNEQLGSIVTKTFLSETEKDTFAEQSVLYLNRKMEELTSAIRDFGRHIVEQLKPSMAMLQSKWVMIIIIITIVIIGAMFAPSIIDTFGGAMDATESALAGSAGSTITPK